jgi:uncharacterized protein
MFPEIKGKYGFGCMRLPMRGEEIDYSTMKKMADAFFKAGFNYVDTAQVYHEGKSEIAIKECITSRYKRDQYLIADKLTSSLFQKESDIRPFFISQLKALGVNYIDFYLMHAQAQENYAKFQECHAYEIAQQLKKEGLVKHVGLSFHDTPEFLDKILTDHPEVEFVQLQFNYLDYDNPDVQSKACYDVCVKHHKPVIVMEPVRGGALVAVGQEAASHIQKIGKGSMASFALRFAASFPSVFMVLSGVSNYEQMADNINTMKDFVPLTIAEQNILLEAKDIIIKLNKIPCTSCHYCTGGCPMGIKIPELFSCLNSVKVYHDEWMSNMTFTDLTKEGGLPSSCIECGQCESVCPQHLKIIALLKDVAQQFEHKE